MNPRDPSGKLTAVKLCEPVVDRRQIAAGMPKLSASAEAEAGELHLRPFGNPVSVAFFTKARPGKLFRLSLLFCRAPSSRRVARN